MQEGDRATRWRNARAELRTERKHVFDLVTDLRRSALSQVLVVDDELSMCAALDANFRRSGWQVMTSNGVSDALMKFRHSPCSLVVTDMRMGDGDGIDV